MIQKHASILEVSKMLIAPFHVTQSALIFMHIFHSFSVRVLSKSATRQQPSVFSNHLESAFGWKADENILTNVTCDFLIDKQYTIISVLYKCSFMWIMTALAPQSSLFP